MTATARSLRGVTYGTAAARTNHLVAAVQHRGKRLRELGTLSLSRRGLTTEFRQASLHVTGARAEFFADLVVLRLRRRCILVRLIDEGSQLLDLILAIFE